MISHPNLDHFSAIPDVIARRGINRVILPRFFTELARDNPSADRLIDYIGQAGITVTRVDRNSSIAPAEGVTCDILWPAGERTLQSRTANEGSIVARFSYRNHSILLCGDIEEDTQQQLLNTANLKSDVLLLPHHGSMTPALPAFVQAVDPDVCIRSDRQSDRESDPALLELLKDTTYINTADHGAVSLTIDDTGLQVAGFRD